PAGCPSAGSLRLPARQQRLGLLDLDWRHFGPDALAAIHRVLVAAGRCEAEPEIGLHIVAGTDLVASVDVAELGLSISDTHLPLLPVPVPREDIILRRIMPRTRPRGSGTSPARRGMR